MSRTALAAYPWIVKRRATSRRPRPDRSHSGWRPAAAECRSAPAASLA